MTRAVSAVLRGNPRRAIRYNPRIVPVALIGAGLLISDARTILRQRQAQAQAQLSPQR
jgi:hypothetical protein